MKHYFLLLCIATSLLSCSEDDENSNKNNLIGKWNWTSSIGGIDGRTDTPTSTGNQITLEISENSIKKVINNDVAFDTEYSIEIRQSILFGEKRNMIIYESDFNQTIEINQNQLVLTDECYDCFRNEYIRQ